MGVAQGKDARDNWGRHRRAGHPGVAAAYIRRPYVNARRADIYARAVIAKPSLHGGGIVPCVECRDADDARVAGRIDIVTTVVFIARSRNDYATSLVEIIDGG